MIVYNAKKTATINITLEDLEKGKLVPDTLTIHHDEVQEQQEETRLELLSVSEITGGKEYMEVITKPYIPYQEAYDETIEIIKYVKN